MRTRLTQLAVAVLVVTSIALGGWLTWRRLSSGETGGAGLVRLEQALEGPDTFALVHVDLARLRALGAGATLEPALLRATGLRGVEAHGEISRVLLALSLDSERVEVAAILLGRFDTGAIEAALGGDFALRVEEASRGGERVLYVDRRDAETCRESRIGVALAPERIAVAQDSSFEELLVRLGSTGLDSADIQDGEPLLTVRWNGALALPDAVGQPGSRALLAVLREALGDPTRVRATARADRQGRLGLEVAFDASDAVETAAVLERWRVFRAEQRPDWSRSMPGLAGWVDALELTNDGISLRATARLDARAAAVAQLADDWLVLAARAFPSSPSPLAGVDEPWPTAFRDSHALSSVPPYRADAPLAGAADAISGPFGIRIERVREPEASELPRGLDVELRAVGPDIPNLPAPDASPRLVIEGVRSASGESLLDAKACGSGRSDVPQGLLRSSPAPLVEAVKTLRLRPRVGVDEIRQIAGRVELELAVRTQSVRLSELRAGQRLEAPGTSLEITAIAARGFAYRVRGDAANLIHVRGLDEAGAALSGRESWQVDLPVSGDRIGALRYPGELAAIEAIFALERERAVFPFTLESARPGSDGEAMHVESSSFIRYSAAQYDREFHAHHAEPRYYGHRFAAVSTAGPFQVGLGELSSGGVVAPQLTVIAPDIPNLTYNATGLELRLEQLVLRDRGKLAPDVRAPITPGHRFGNLDLEGEVRLVTGVTAMPADVEQLSGELVLRLPSRVEVLELNEVEPGRSAASGRVAFTLSELARDGFTLRMQGALGRFFSARAYAADGHELAVKHTEIGSPDAAGARELRFRVQGQPRRIAIQLARGSTTRRYPFALVPPSQVPAATP